MAATDKPFDKPAPDWDQAKADQESDELRERVLEQIERERRARAMRRLDAQLEYLRIHGRTAW